MDEILTEKQLFLLYIRRMKKSVQDFEDNFIFQLERKMSGNPVSLTSGSLSIPSSDLLCPENEFGVLQSPHQESYIISNSRHKPLMESWEKSSIKPIEIFPSPCDNTELPECPDTPDVVLTESPTKEPTPLAKLRQASMPKMMQIYDEFHEEMFQLDDEIDDMGPDPIMFAALQKRKMSRSTEDLNPLKNEVCATHMSEPKKHLQKFRSDSNLHTEESNMSLVEKITMLNLSAGKKDVKTPHSAPLRMENSEESFGETDSTLKRWLLTKSVSVSKREMNAISPFPS